MREEEKGRGKIQGELKLQLCYHDILSNTGWQIRELAVSQGFLIPRFLGANPF